MRRHCVVKGQNLKSLLSRRAGCHSLFTASPLRDDEDSIIGVVAESKSIIERKELEERLKETVEKLKASQEELSTPVTQIWRGYWLFLS